MKQFPFEANQFAQEVRMSDVEQRVVEGDVAGAMRLCQARINLLNEVIGNVLEAIPQSDRAVDDVSAYIEQLRGTPTSTEWLDELQAHYDERMQFLNKLAELKDAV